jgi:hypothetical protein
VKTLISPSRVSCSFRTLFHCVVCCVALSIGRRHSLSLTLHSDVSLSFYREWRISDSSRGTS